MSAAIEAAMLEAHRAGLSVIPLRSGKRPAVPSWAEYVDTQPDEMLVSMWAKQAEGFAILCGGPQRVQVLDFESRFQRLYELNEAFEQTELRDLWKSWCDGYLVGTPSGGMHVAVHVMGEGPQDGNRKLAMDAEGQVLIETRGHGGYVVAAPSNGSTHQSGGVWVQSRGSFDEIAWATEEEWAAVCATIATFDAGYASVVAESPPVPISPAPGGLSIARIEHPNSWIDGVQMPTVEHILENTGWTYVHSDAEHNYWVRPGKDPRDGWSATVNRSGRLFVFSSNATPVPPSQGRQTYDATDVIGCYDLGHLPSTSERVEIIRRFGRLSGQRPQPVHVPVDITEPTGWISDDFWEEREYLRDIRDAAWAAGRCPEAFLGAVLSTYATLVPCSVTLEALAGGTPSPLNYYVAMVGQPGAGKSGAISAGHQLVGVRDSKAPDAPYRFGVVPRSGESFPEIALIPQPKNKDQAPLNQLHRNGFQIIFDEGSSLAAQNDRAGTTTLQYLCTAWSGLPGQMVGGVLASGEKSYPADEVRISMVMGIQYGVGAALFQGWVAAQGFPARLVCFASDRPGDLSQRRRGAIERLTLSRRYPSANDPLLLTFPQSVYDEVEVWDDARQRSGVDPLDGHMMLVRMRTSGLLALMDGAAQIELAHWQLAGEVERHSRHTRGRVLAAAHDVDLQRVRAAGRMDAQREKAKLDAQIEDRARAVAQYVHNEAPFPVAWNVIRQRMRNDVRKNLDSIVAHAVERGWVAVTREGRKRTLLPGDSRPS